MISLLQIYHLFFGGVGVSNHLFKKIVLELFFEFSTKFLNTRIGCAKCFFEICNFLVDLKLAEPGVSHLYTGKIGVYAFQGV